MPPKKRTPEEIEEADKKAYDLLLKEEKIKKMLEKGEKIPEADKAIAYKIIKKSGKSKSKTSAPVGGVVDALVLGETYIMVHPIQDANFVIFTKVDGKVTKEFARAGSVPPEDYEVPVEDESGNTQRKRSRSSYKKKKDESDEEEDEEHEDEDKPIVLVQRQTQEQKKKK